MEATLAKRVSETGDELAPKQLAEHGNRQEEARPGVDPLGPIRRHVRPSARRSGRGDGAAVVGPTCGGPSARRCCHRGASGSRRPGVRLRQPPETGGRTPRAYWRARGARAVRHREDDVDVADRQQLLLARRHPRVASRGQTLRAMPIATAVVREDRLRALLTAITMPTQCRRSALGDGSEHASMLPGHPGLVRLQETIAMSAHDIGHLEGWPRHRLCSRRDL